MQQHRCEYAYHTTSDQLLRKCLWGPGGQMTCASNAASGTTNKRTWIQQTVCCCLPLISPVPTLCAVSVAVWSRRLARWSVLGSWSHSFVWAFSKSNIASLFLLHSQRSCIFQVTWHKRRLTTKDFHVTNMYWLLAAVQGAELVKRVPYCHAAARGLSCGQHCCKPVCHSLTRLK